MRRYDNLGYNYCTGRAVWVSTARTRAHLLLAWLRIINNERTIRTDQRPSGLCEDDHAPVPRGDVPRKYGRAHHTPERIKATTGRRGKSRARKASRLTWRLANNPRTNVGTPTVRRETTLVHGGPPRQQDPETTQG